MALQQYTSAAVYIKGSLLAEEASIDINRHPGFTRVLTVAKGLAGVSPGARFMEMRISNAVPAVGFEYDPGPDMEGLVVVPVLVFAADSSLTTTAFIEGDDFKHAVNSEGMLDIRLLCSWALWQ